MKQRTKIQKLKKALPGIVKDVKHYAKPRVKLHNKGLEIIIQKVTVL